MRRILMICYACRALKRDQQGANMIEFALIAPILFFMIFGIIEIGMIMLAQSTIESATTTTTRTARVGNDGGTGNLEQFIRDEIQRATGGLIDSNRVVITTQTENYVDIDTPEPCFIDPPPPAGTCPGAPGVAYDDLNDNGQYDWPALDLDSGDVLNIAVHYPYSVITPGVGLIFGANNGEFVITSRTLVVKEGAQGLDAPPPGGRP